MLKYQNVNLVLIEAQKESLSPIEGLEQVKNYGIKLGLRILYSTNEHKIYELDLQTGVGDVIYTYPRPQELHQRLYSPMQTLTQKLLSISLLKSDGKQQRYCQEIAIRRTMEAVGDGRIGYYSP